MTAAVKMVTRSTHEDPRKRMVFQNFRSNRQNFLSVKYVTTRKYLVKQIRVKKYCVLPKTKKKKKNLTEILMFCQTNSQIWSCTHLSKEKLYIFTVVTCHLSKSYTIHKIISLVSDREKRKN